MQLIAGIILAAGASSRMGEDKALLRCPSTFSPGPLSSTEGWGGKTFLEHLRAALKDSGVGLMRVVLGGNAEAVRKQIAFGAAEVVINREWEKGQLSSLIAALDTLPPGLVEAAVICLVDHPCISSGLIRTLIAEFRESRKPIVMPSYRGGRGHPVLFSATLFGELRAAPLSMGARHVVYQHASDILEVATEEEGVVMNINNRGAYERILQKSPPD